MKQLLLTLAFVCSILGPFAEAEQISVTENHVVAPIHTLSDVPPG
ncbi:hypothetical protein [Jeotgalibacillus marinus]|uniref:Uncharacterized protein n=1 Tax=Jeotgalibacillus marinus TaxID=86667 RepID=A0ABV3Q5B4_9BACL